MSDNLIYSLNTYLVLLTGLFTLFLAALVYIRNRKSPVNLSFALVCLSASLIWLFTFLMFTAGSTAKVVFYDKLIYVVLAFSPTFVYQFGLYFTKTISVAKKRALLYFGYFLSLLFLALVPTDYLVKDVFVYKWGIHTKAQFMHHFYLTYLFSYIIVFYRDVYIFYRGQARTIEREQARYIMMALAFFVWVGPVGFLPAYSIPILPFTSYAGLLMYASIITYAIVKHRLMDIRLLLLKSVAYTLTFALVAVGYIALTLFVTQKLTHLVNPIVLNIVTLFILIFTFQPLRRLIEQSGRLIFAKGLYDFKELMGQLTEITKINSRSIDSLTSELMQALIKNVNVSRAAFVLAEGGQFSEIKALGFGTSYRAWEKPVNVVLKANETVAYDEVEEGGIEKEVLRNAQVQVLIPIKTEERCEAVLALGEKKSGDMYTAQDLNLLELIAPQIALTLENARLYEQATTDALTGLYHQKYFQVRLNSELERSKRFGYPLSLIMLDIDFFKDINDKYGHQAGDKVLIELTKLIKDNVRSYDVVGRYGGDEFVMLLPVVNKGDARSHKKTAKQIANRLRKVIEDHSFTNMDLKVQVSLGIAICDGKTAPNCDCLIEKADQLLYKAKNSGRNTVCIESLKSKRVA